MNYATTWPALFLASSGSRCEVTVTVSMIESLDGVSEYFYTTTNYYCTFSLSKEVPGKLTEDYSYLEEALSKLKNP